MLGKVVEWWKLEEIGRNECCSCDEETGKYSRPLECIPVVFVVIVGYSNKFYHTSGMEFFDLNCLAWNRLFKRLWEKWEER